MERQKLSLVQARIRARLKVLADSASGGECLSFYYRPYLVHTTYLVMQSLANDGVQDNVDLASETYQIHDLLHLFLPHRLHLLL